MKRKYLAPEVGLIRTAPASMIASSGENSLFLHSERDEEIEEDSEFL